MTLWGAPRQPWGSCQRQHRQNSLDLWTQNNLCLGQCLQQRMKLERGQKQAGPSLGSQENLSLLLTHGAIYFLKFSVPSVFAKSSHISIRKINATELLHLCSWECIKECFQTRSTLTLLTRAVKGSGIDRGCKDVLPKVSFTELTGISKPLQENGTWLT